MTERPWVCLKEGCPQIGRQCVALWMVMIACKAKLTTTSAKLQAAKWDFVFTFDHLKRHFSTVWPARAALPEHMKSNWQNYIQKVLYHVKQSSETHKLNVEGHILPFWTELTQDIRSTCTRFTKRLDRMRQDVSDSAKDPSFQ